MYLYEEGCRRGELQRRACDAPSVASRQHILIIEDEPVIRRALHANLEGCGYAVASVASGEQAVREVEARRPDLVVLDLLVLGAAGLPTCQGVRAGSTMPLLVLCGHGGRDLTVRALDMGADDALVRPFGTAELLARIRALLRRGALLKGRPGRLAAGEFVLDLDLRQAWHAGAALALTRPELDTLLCLMLQAGRTVTSRQVLGAVWESGSTASEQYARVLFDRLRCRIEADPQRPRYLFCEPGVGYRFLPAGVPTGAGE